jgi:hypothetical protein
MLLYNASGIASEIIVTSIIDGKATSSLVTAPTINDSLLSSASNAIINNATTVGSSSAAAYGLGYTTNQNPTNTGYTYKSSAPSTRRLSTQSGSMAFALQYPTNTNRSRGTNYWITGSMIIAAGEALFVSSSYGLGPANTSAKVSIPVGNFVGKNTRIVNDSNDIKRYSILGYNGIISTIAGYNEFSSSTFNNISQSYAVFHISASKADMGTVVTSPLVVSLGTSQNRS